MRFDVGFGLSIAAGILFWTPWFLINRRRVPPACPMRIHKTVAVLAGSRTEWLSYYSLAFQIGFASCPVWYVLLYWGFNTDIFHNALFMAFLSVGVLQQVFRLYARKSLRAAEYLRLGFRARVAARGHNLVEYNLVCKYCGYQEPVFSFAAMQLSAQPKDYHSALSSVSRFGPWVPVVSLRIAEALRAAEATGLVLVPVGGNEPAEWYGLCSNHILPPRLGEWQCSSELPFRTRQCERDHGIEPLSRIFESDIFYRRSTFDALDFNYSYELSGNGSRRGIRSIVISQRMFRLLVKIDKEILWDCQPVRFVN